MSSCLQSYRICCRCATVELPDFIISNVLPGADCHSVLETFLLHFNINLSPSDLAVVVLIFSGRRLNTKDSVGAVFGSVPDPCVHVIIPPASIPAPKSHHYASLSVAPAPALEVQPRFTAPSLSYDPIASSRDASAALTHVGNAASHWVLATAISSNDEASENLAAKSASLEAWALYYERVSFEWLQRWGVTRDHEALSNYELAVHYARGCRMSLSELTIKLDSNFITSSHSSQFVKSDARSREESSARAAAAGTALFAAEQHHAVAPQVDIMPQAAAAQPQAANVVDPALPVNPAVGGVGAGLLALVVRAAVTMYILSSSQPNGRMGWAVLACILIYLINTNRLTFLLKLVYPATRFVNALDPNAEPFVEPEWQHPGYFKGFLLLVLGFFVSVVPAPYAYADLN